MLINKKLQYLVKNSISEEALTEIATLTESEASSARKYESIAVNVSQNNLVSATATLNNLSNLNLNVGQELELAKQMQIMTIRTSLESQSKSWYEMSESELNTIIALSEDSTSTAGLQAITIRSLVTDYEYYPEVIILDIPTENKSAKVETASFAGLLAKPNPATEYFTVEYTLLEKETTKNSQIKLFNESGVEIQDFKLKHNTDQFLVDCENLLPGKYNVKKIVKGRVIASQEVVVLGTGDKIANKSIFTEIELMQISPNPAKLFFSVNCNLPKDKASTTFSLKDISGKVIYQKEITASVQFEVSTESFASGIYFANFAGKLIKVVIEK